MSPATLTTGLSWYAGTGSLAAYSPQVFTATGLTCGTCTWSLNTVYATEDGTSRFDLGTLTACQTTPTVACTYTAPTDYGTGTPTITIQATDGTHTATATITLVYPANLREAMLHQGRLEVYYSVPWSMFTTGCEMAVTAQVCYQPWPLWFDPTGVAYPNGTGWNFQPMDRRGWMPWLPPILGIQQPQATWTRDGNWLGNQNSGLVIYTPTKGGPITNVPWLVRADGGSPQILPGPRDFVHDFGAGVGLGNWTPLERGDGELIAEGFAGPQDNALGLLDLAVADGTTNYYKQAKAYELPQSPAQSNLVPIVQNNANISGYYGTHFLATQRNPGLAGTIASCTLASTCSDIPNIYDLDLSACYASLADNCATLAHPAFSIHLGITGLGWGNNDQGVHCDVPGDPLGGTECEYHVHASGTRKETSIELMNYGSSGGAGEEMAFGVDTSDPTHTPILEWPDARYPTTGLTPPFTNTPYFGHGDWSFNGNYFMGSGNQTCTPNASHACTDLSTTGEHIYDFRAATNGILKWGGTAVSYSANTTNGQSHSSWDTYDLANSFADGWSGTSGGNVAGNTFQGFDDYVPPSQAKAQVWLDFGDRSGSDAGSMFWNPVVTPDGTLASESVPPAFACFNPGGGKTCQNGQTNQNIPWETVGALLRYEPPPVNLTMTNSGGSAAPTFSFAPNFLNHDAASYNVYRCTAASSGCSFLQSVPAVYQNIYNGTLYSFTDSTFTSSGTFWYGVAAVDRAGIEGDMLSHLDAVSFGSGIYSHQPTLDVGAGTGHFDSAIPATTAWVSGAEEHMPTAQEAGVYPWTYTQGTGGSLPDDWYWVFVTLVQCKDYPSCTQLTTSPATGVTANSVQVTSGGGTASVNFQTNFNDMWGQHGYQIWMAQTTTSTPPAQSSYTLQTCAQSTDGTFYQLPLYGETPPTIPSLGTGTAAVINCTINSFSTATAFGTPADTTVQDFKLVWTANVATDRVAYWDVYYAEGSAPILTKGEDAAQPQLIASIPASYCAAGSACTWRDSAPSIGAVDAGTHIVYGLVPVGQNGLRGTPSCWDATAGASIACQ